MLGASLYVIVCTARNRLRVRLRRLRQPRYALGLLAALAYLYFALFGFGGQRPRSDPRAGPPLELVTAVEQAGAVVTACLLALAAVVAWLVPVGGGLLEFTRAEIQFLYPAPVHRRWLLVYRLLGSQVGILVSSMVPALVLSSGGTVPRLRLVVALWVVLVTLRLYFTGTNLARPRLNHPDLRARWVARAPVVLTLVVSSAMVFALAAEFNSRPVELELDALSRRLAALGHDGPLAWILAPFLALTRPLYAGSWRAYAEALPGATLVLAVALLWILESDQAFEAAAEAAVQGHDRHQSTLTRQRYRTRRAPWVLPLRGGVEGALVWKAATESVRLLNVQGLLWSALPLVAFGLAGSLTGAFQHGLAQIVAVASLFLAGFVVAMGPQVIRSDLRRDLVHLDVLKTWPAKPAGLLRGAIVWPAALLSFVAAAGIVGGAALGSRAFPEVDPAWRAALAAAALALAPGLVTAQLVIHNGVALLFPAWVSLGGHRPRGIDAVGQRLITLGGTWAVLALMALPGAVLGGLAWLALARWLAMSAMVVGAVVAGLVLLAEALAMTELLGPLFDRLDLTDIERAE